MSKELPQNNNKSEEVDLIVFFNLIGNAFQKLFNWIASIFSTIFGVLILILAHFYKRAVWYGLVIIIGFAIGVYLDRSSEKRYGANMFIETNYNSGYQVYENIKNLNELAGVDKDTLELARIFNLSVIEAASLKGFYIQPDIDPVERMQMYSDFREGLDSVARNEAKYDNFIVNTNQFNYRTHKIGVASTDKNIYSKLNKNLANIISKNPYLNKLKAIGQENFRREEETLIRQQNKIDSLIDIYLGIRTFQSNNSSLTGSAGTNLYLGNAQKNELLIDEASLLQEKLTLEEQRRQINVKKVKGENIVSVISDFPSSGYDISEWTDKRFIQIPLLLILILVIVFIFIGLGEFLKKQKAI